MADLPAQFAEALRDRYLLERELARGGMATVYLAHDLKHGRPVALKVLHLELAATLGPDRFLREIRLAAQLQHPHILSVYDSGDAGGRLWFTMPYVEGETLRERLRREGQLPLDDALRIARETADALDYAHQHGVIHRDIKPENILLTARHALVADFGIARAVSSGPTEQPEDVTREQRLTETGVIVGTPAYMSPEQAAGDRFLDWRTDLYSLGCVLYEMLAGAPPFAGPTAQAILARRLTEAVPPLSPHRDVSPELERAVARALARSPADRFATLGDFVAALQPVSAPARIRHWPRAAVVVGLGIAALAGGVALILRGTPTPRFGRRTQVTLEPGLEIDPALSPDGKLLAYVAGPPGEMRLYVRQLGGGAPIAVARDGERFARTPYWSPDGSRLLFLSDRGIELAPALGGTSRLLVAAAGSLVAGPIAPAGRSFAYARNDSLYVQALPGSAPRLLAVAHELHSISWSPDGQWIAYVTGNIHFVWDVSLGNSAPSSIWIVPAAGGAPSPVTDDQALNASPVWAPGGRELLFVSDRDGSRDVYALVLRRAGRPAGAPARLSAGLNALGISLSADGTKLAYANFVQTSNVWSLPIPSDGPVSIGQAQPLTTGARSIDFFEISPDGRWLVFDAARSGPHQVFRVPLAGGEPEQLTDDSTSVGSPTYSPDGREIAFHAWRDGHRQVFVMPAVGGTATRVTHTAVEEFLPVWDPRGGRLAVRGSAGGDSWLEVTTRDADGRWSEPRRLDAALAGAGRSALCWVSFFTWSPEGRWLATSCWRGGPALVLFSPNGGPGRVLVPDSSAFAPRPAWSGDGRSVYYFADESGAVRSINVVPVSGGKARALVRFDDPTRPWRGWGFEAYGGRFYVTLGDLQSELWVANLQWKR